MTKPRKPQEKKVTVFEADRAAADARWRKKGWRVMRTTYGDTVQGKTTVVLHLQREGTA